MKKSALLLLLFINSIISAQEYERNVLFEMFTNSHCPLCTSAYAAFESYLANGANADKLNYIFYHMVYPYSDDPIYQANPTDAAGRNSYYGPYTSTPVAFFDGVRQPNNYGSWSGNIDNLFIVKSPALIELGGTVEGTTVKLDANVEFGSNVPSGSAVIHFVVTETINYTGRNGISIHKNSMREMITGAEGESISTSGSTLVSKTFDLDNSWDPADLEFIVFIQNSGTKDIYQSASVSYGDLVPTSIENNLSVPNEFSLRQNYPNPFNPSTAIEYSIPDAASLSSIQGQRVVLKVYDILGRDIATLVDKNQSPGNYSVNFDASGLPSGIYFYTLNAGKQVVTRKMTLLR